MTQDIPSGTSQLITTSLPQPSRELSLVSEGPKKSAVDSNRLVDRVKADRWAGARITDLSRKYDLPYDEIKKIVLEMSNGCGADGDTIHAQRPGGRWIELPNDLDENEREELRLEYIKYNREQDEDMQAIAAAIRSDLPIEVLYFAMQDLQHNPKQSISAAISYGFCEWIK